MAFLEPVTLTGDLDPEYRREVVHRDEMVLVGPRAPKPVATA